jgi:hypothetical protein
MMSLARWFHGDIKTMPEMREHIDGTPDVPDIVHPCDWITDDGIGFSMVVKTVKGIECEWDLCPGAESWWIYYLGVGYMTGEKISIGDCGCKSHIVAVDGRLLQLYKLGWNETEVIIVPKPNYVVVSRSAMLLVARENPAPNNTPLQLSLFAWDGN